MTKFPTKLALRLVRNRCPAVIAVTISKSPSIVLPKQILMPSSIIVSVIG